MLTQLKHQFDFVVPGTELARYELIVLPDAVDVSAELARQLTAYVSCGGAVLCTGVSGLDTTAEKLNWELLPVQPRGMSPFSTTYMRFGAETNSDVPDSDHVLYDKTMRVTPSSKASVLAQVVEPYFERAWNHFSSHAQTPSDSVSEYALAVSKGRIGYIAAPVFSSFGSNGNYPLRLLVRNLITRLLPEPLLRVQAPTSTEATVMQQGERTIVHLLQYCPERRTATLDIVEDIVPLHYVPLSLRLATAPRSVYSAPDNSPVPFTYKNGRVEVVLPTVTGHAMVVFD